MTKKEGEQANNSDDDDDEEEGTDKQDAQLNIFGEAVDEGGTLNQIERLKDLQESDPFENLLGMKGMYGVSNTKNLINLGDFISEIEMKQYQSKMFSSFNKNK